MCNVWTLRIFAWIFVRIFVPIFVRILNFRRLMIYVVEFDLFRLANPGITLTFSEPDLTKKNRRTKSNSILIASSNLCYARLTLLNTIIYSLNSLQRLVILKRKCSFVGVHDKIFGVDFERIEWNCFGGPVRSVGPFVCRSLEVARSNCVSWWKRIDWPESSGVKERVGWLFFAVFSQFFTSARK